MGKRSTAQRQFAVFDIDGTLIRWQLYHAVVDNLAKNHLLGKGTHEKLQEARMQWKKRAHPDAFTEYEGALVAVYESALQALETDVFDEAVQEVIEEYKDQVYTYTRDLIKELKAKGYFLLAISGSHHELVEQVARQYGFDDWVGTKYERRGTHFSGESFIVSHHKKQILDELISKHKLSANKSIAVGDSSSDIPMLEMVENPIAFNPDRTLLEAAQDNGWKIVVERKNVVYQLEHKNSCYQLIAR